MNDQRTLHFNAFLMSNGHHEASWRLPESDPAALYDLAHWQRLAAIAERGKLDSIFLADGPSLQHDARLRPAGALDPLILLTALATSTQHIGLIATASSTYNSPYNLARRFASLDHVSGGRAGWNIVTTAGTDAARNFGRDERPDHRDRYVRATEFVDVAIKLWDSWEDDARVLDKDAGRYADDDKIHAINHVGSQFRVQGPLNVPRSPQGRPVLIQAGSSQDGREFAARYAEGIFTAAQTLEDGQAFYADIKQRAARLGRGPNTVKILPGVVPVLGSTEAEARALDRQLEELSSPEYGLQQLSVMLEVPIARLALDEPLPADIVADTEVEGMQSRRQLVIELARRDGLTVRQLIARLGGGRSHRTFVGTPEQVAATIQTWFDSGAADGFNIMPAVLPSGLELFVEHVVPIFQKRGLFRTEYTGRTLREHYGLPWPENQFAPARQPARTVA